NTDQSTATNLPFSGRSRVSGSCAKAGTRKGSLATSWPDPGWVGWPGSWGTPVHAASNDATTANNTKDAGFFMNATPEFSSKYRDMRLPPPQSALPPLVV